MQQFDREAAAWIQDLLDRRRSEATALGIWHAGLGLGLVLAWYVGITGLYGIPYFILGFAGVPFPCTPWVFGALWLAGQFLLYPLARRARRRGYEFLHAAGDGELVVLAPPRQADDPEAGGQDHDFSFRRGYLGVLFAAQIALDEARRQFADARAARHLERERLALLAGVLMSAARKMTLRELAAALPGTDLRALLADAAQLPGFHIHTQDPQGVSLTDEGRDGVLVSGVPET